ncbi:hypothetical protein C5167_005554 [Papaver somniferum]|uniref:Protein BCCIP homolog n=1 Tax=Papaver somniferum TaxID=3469 RepID=A0A4Y7JEL8_PAPSO|nr:hypothetical protein C5167_005554 [Papaver somniferum]
MTRRPSNRRHRPLGFSSFARNVDLMACKSTKLKQLSSSKSDEKAPVKSQGDEIEKRCMKGKGVLSESSSEEESDSEVENDSEEENDGVIKVRVDTKPIKELKNFLLRSCKEKDIVGDLRILLNEEAQGIGLLVIKHVNNIPPELLPPLYNILFNEVAQAAKHEPTYFKFKVHLLITRIYKLNNANQRKGTSKNDSDEPILYVWPEDEVFHKLSLWSFTFPLRSRPTDEMKNYNPMGLVMALEAKKVPTFQKELQSLISES